MPSNADDTEFVRGAINAAFCQLVAHVFSTCYNGEGGDADARFDRGMRMAIDARDRAIRTFVDG